MLRVTWPRLYIILLTPQNKDHPSTFEGTIIISLTAIPQFHSVVIFMSYYTRSRNDNIGKFTATRCWGHWNWARHWCHHIPFHVQVNRAGCAVPVKFGNHYLWTFRKHNVTGIGQGIGAITSPSMSKWIELGVECQSSLGTTICEPSESIKELSGAVQVWIQNWQSLH